MENGMKLANVYDNIQQCKTHSFDNPPTSDPKVGSLPDELEVIYITYLYQMQVSII